MTKSRKLGRGGKRPGAGRKPKATVLAATLAEPLDPRRVLEEIAADRLSPASARVNAARALLAAQNAKPNAADASAARADDVERRTLEILNRRTH
jgi:hypothetical protein